MTPRREQIWLALMFAGYCVSRLYDLDSFPAFIDEALHIDWARATLRGDLLAGSWDGKWLAIKIMAVFVALPLHPLLAARLTAALAGAVALATAVLVARRLYSSSEGLVAGLLYVALPFALLYNRLALADSIAAAFAGAVLYLSVVVATSNHRGAGVAVLVPDLAVMALAAALVGMFLAKFNTVVLIPIPIAAVVLLRPKPEWPRHLARLGPAFAALAVPLVLMIWRRHGVHFLGEKAPVGSWWSQLALIGHNLQRLSGWLSSLLTPPLAIPFLLSLLWVLRRKRERADLLLAVAFLLSVVPFVLGARIWFPRYLMPALVPLCVLLARFVCAVVRLVSSRHAVLDSGAVRAVVAVSAVAILAWPLWVDANLILSPESVSLPRVERAALRQGWSAGHGVPQMAAFLRQRSLAAPAGINVVRFYFWNQANQGLDLYLSPSPSLAIHTIDPTDPGAAAKVASFAGARPTFFVLNPPNDAEHLAEIGKSLDDYFRGAGRVWQYERAGGESAVEVWELHRQ